MLAASAPSIVSAMIATMSPKPGIAKPSHSSGRYARGMSGFTVRSAKEMKV